MILQRTTESPKHKREEVQRRYPDYKIIGDRAGWFYPVEQTKVVVMSVGWKSLVKETREHLRGNDLPVPPNLDLVLQEFWCSEVGGEACGEPPPIVSTDLPALAERFLRTVKNFAFSGGERVTQEEAERRAAICAACEFNSMDGSFCSGCFLRSLTTSAVAMVSGWKTSHDSKLGYCLKCGCKNQLKVFVKREHMDFRDLRDKWPSHCWMKEEPSDKVV